MDRVNALYYSLCFLTFEQGDLMLHYKLCEVLYLWTNEFVLLLYWEGNFPLLRICVLALYYIYKRKGGGEWKLILGDWIDYWIILWIPALDQNDEVLSMGEVDTDK